MKETLEQRKIEIEEKLKEEISKHQTYSVEMQKIAVEITKLQGALQEINALLNVV